MLIVVINMSYIAINNYNQIISQPYYNRMHSLIYDDINCYNLVIASQTVHRTRNRPEICCLTG
jgi:hypothetical protein